MISRAPFLIRSFMRARPAGACTALSLLLAGSIRASADDFIRLDYTYPLEESISIDTKLPDITESGRTPVDIVSSNLTEYRGMIPPEIRPSVAKGNFSIRAAGRLGFDWSTEGGPEDNQPNLPPEPGTAAPYPKLTEYPADSRGERVLWNAAMRLAAGGSVSQKFDMRWYRDENSAVSISGSFDRVYPFLSGTQFEPPQLFRERVLLRQPDLLSGLGWLTIRLISDDEDGVWERSPVIQRTVRLTGSNRGDSFIGSPLTANDFFGSSEKPQELSVVSAELGIFLLPVASVKESEGEKRSDGCVSVATPRARSAVTVKETTKDRESDRPDRSPAVPTITIEPSHRNLLFVPRKAWRVEARERDPYSRAGTIVVYVDAVSFLPHLKVVSGRGGELLRAVFAPYGGLMRSESTVPRVPHLGRLVVESAEAHKFVVLEATENLVCGAGSTAPVAAADLIPGKFVPSAKQAASSGAAPAAKPTVSVPKITDTEEIPDTND